MAYQNVAEPAQVLIEEVAATRRFFARIGAAFTAAGTKIMENSSGAKRVEAVQRLQALSDAELAKLNIKRDEIVNYVFKDVYYI